MRDLVASPFSKRIQDYDMPDGIKVLTNLRTYDGTTDPYDHLTVFMWTMDVHKLPEPALCRFFHITLCGATRFWYDNLAPRIIDGFHQLRDKFRVNFLQQRRFQKTQAKILGIRQRPDESLKEYWAAPRALVQRLDSKATDITCGFVHTNPQLHTTKDTNNENRIKDTCDPQTEWNRKANTDVRTKNEIHMIQAVDANTKKSRFSFPNIAFSKDDPIPEHCTGEDPLIILADVGTTEIHRIYVDGGSSAEIMYEHCFEQVTSKKRNRATDSFARQIRWSDIMSFRIHNIVIHLVDYRNHRPGLIQFGAVASTLHALMKFQTEKGIAVVRGERFQLNICNHISRKRDRPKEANSTEDIEHIIINNAYMDQTLAIAANLPKMLKKQLHELLCSNKDVFAWTPVDMTGIPQELAEHKLNIHPRTFHVWQKKRVIAKEQSEAITAEVSKLVEA
ncbi:reverse transcriptase domain-containing protein [Tanacetum coccineum]|uniref:Reverse transcriptase domain-containing protein n=1 Tax=Tanacetum coccineum TaxID=301880 RepID=A0ABQ4YX92_9ASTR